MYNKVIICNCRIAHTAAFIDSCGSASKNGTVNYECFLHLLSFFVRSDECAVIAHAYQINVIFYIFSYCFLFG